MIVSDSFLQSLSQVLFDKPSGYLVVYIFDSRDPGFRESGLFTSEFILLAGAMGSGDLFTEFSILTGVYTCCSLQTRYVIPVDSRQHRGVNMAKHSTLAPLSVSFGAIVTGLDLRRMSDYAFEELYDSWLEYGC